jgi:hypothetical protein
VAEIAEDEAMFFKKRRLSEQRDFVEALKALQKDKLNENSDQPIEYIDETIYDEEQTTDDKEVLEYFPETRSEGRDHQEQYELSKQERKEVQELLSINITPNDLNFP